jgi:hypothetical protein
VSSIPSVHLCFRAYPSRALLHPTWAHGCAPLLKLPATENDMTLLPISLHCVLHLITKGARAHHAERLGRGHAPVGAEHQKQHMPTALYFVGADRLAGLVVD